MTAEVLVHPNLRGRNLHRFTSTCFPQEEGAVTELGWLPARPQLQGVMAVAYSTEGICEDHLPRYSKAVQSVRLTCLLHTRLAITQSREVGGS